MINTYDRTLLVIVIVTSAIKIQEIVSFLFQLTEKEPIYSEIGERFDFTVAARGFQYLQNLYQD